MTQGWVKLHRKVWQWPYADKPSYLSVWIWLLTNATHTERDQRFNGKVITLKPGQLITGRKAISAQTRVSESTIQRILQALENEHQIEQQKTNLNRLITIVSWDQYQHSEQQNEHQMNIKRTSNEHQMNTNKNVKNNKNEKNDKKTHTPPSGVEGEIWDEFLMIRKKLKAVNSDRAINGLKNKLAKFSQQGHNPNKLIEQSIINSWKDVYEPRNVQRGQQREQPQKLSTVEQARLVSDRRRRELYAEIEQERFEASRSCDDGILGSDVGLKGRSMGESIWEH